MLQISEPVKLLDIVYSRLTKRVLCTSNLKRGSFFKNKEDAIKNYRYIRLNSQKLRSFLIFDMDIADCCPIKLSNSTGIPQPNLVIVNNETKHSHWVYILETPVATSSISSQKAIRYVDNIYKLYCEKLKADQNYSGVLVQNPFYNNFFYEQGWGIFYYSKKLYSLSCLAKPVQFELYNKKSIRLKNASNVDYFVGRNCHIFSTLSEWALKNYTKEHVHNWYEKIKLQAREFNNQLSKPLDPLDANELKHIVNSIYRYTLRNDDKILFQNKEFSKIQRGRQEKSLQKRLQKRQEKVKQAQQLYVQSVPLQQITAGIDRSLITLHRWKKQGILGDADRLTQQQEKARYLYSNFVPLNQIASDVDCCLTTLYSWKKQGILGSANRLTQQQEKARCLYSNSVPLKQITSHVGCSLVTLYRWKKQGILGDANRLTQQQEKARKKQGILGSANRLEERQKKARCLYSNSVPLKEIASHVGCSLATLYRWKKQGILGSANRLEERQKKARCLYSNSVPLKQIASHVGCSLVTLYRWKKQGILRV